jgi:hypothetical protein
VSRVRTSIHIARPRRAVYDFAATPRTWALWHPGRVAVSGIVDRPPAVGERVMEKLAFAGVQTRLAWEVTARKAPERFSMAAQVRRRGEASLAFTLAPAGKGTLLECEIAYDGVHLHGAPPNQ